MNNNKKQFKAKKHVGLYVTLGLGLSSIIAGSVASIILKKSSEPSLEGKVRFAAGKGHAFREHGSSVYVPLNKPTELFKILPKDELVSNKNGAINDFVGWAKQSDFTNGKINANKLLKSFLTVQPGTAITAVYKSDINDSSTFHTVTFSKGEEKVILTGNTIINVVDGTQFQDINKPSCQSSAIGSDQKCLGWKDGTGQIEDTKKITENITITPIMSEASILHFEHEDMTLSSGVWDVAVKKGATFSTVNQPSFYYPASTSKIFIEWCHDSSCTQPWKQGDSISGNMTAYPKYIDTKGSTDGYNIITAVQPEDQSTEVTYQGGTEFAIKNGLKWNEYNRPIPKCDQLVVSGWQFRQRAKEKVWGAWQNATDTTVFTANYEVEIRPVMGSSITSVTINQQKTPVVIAMQKTKIYAEVLPSDANQSCTFELFYDSNGEKKIPDSSIASIDNSTGMLLVQNKIFEQEDFNYSIYVRATSAVSKSVVSPIVGFLVTDPAFGTDKCWAIDQSTSEWYELLNLCSEDPTAPIQMKKYGATTVTKTTPRNTFNLPVYVGDMMSEVGDFFMNGCSAFNSPIMFYGDCIKLGRNFMAGCSSFNQKFPDSWTATVEEFKDNCMIGCTSFNNGSTSGQPGSPIYLSGTTHIGDNFMFGCTGLNSPLRFDDYETGSLGQVKTIGKGFLMGCTKFNNGGSSNILTLPSTLTSVGDQFMYKCNSYTGTLQLDCAGNIFASQSESQNICADTETASIYNPGFKVVGTGAAAFPFKTNDGSNNIWRKADIQQEEIVGISVVDGSYQKTWNLNDTFKPEGLKLNVSYKTSGSEEVKTKQVSSGYTTNPAKGYALQLTDTTVTVTYLGATTSYSITVTDPHEFSEDDFMTKYKEYYNNFVASEGTGKHTYSKATLTGTTGAGVTDPDADLEYTSSETEPTASIAYKYSESATHTLKAGGVKQETVQERIKYWRETVGPITPVVISFSQDTNDDITWTASTDAGIGESWTINKLGYLTNYVIAEYDSILEQVVETNLAISYSDDAVEIETIGEFVSIYAQYYNQYQQLPQNFYSKVTATGKILNLDNPLVCTNDYIGEDGSRSTKLSYYNSKSSTLVEWNMPLAGGTLPKDLESQLQSWKDANLNVKLYQNANGISYDVTSNDGNTHIAASFNINGYLTHLTNQTKGSATTDVTFEWYEEPRQVNHELNNLITISGGPDQAFITDVTVQDFYDPNAYHTVTIDTTTEGLTTTNVPGRFGIYGNQYDDWCTNLSEVVIKYGDLELEEGTHYEIILSGDYACIQFINPSDWYTQGSQFEITFKSTSCINTNAKVALSFIGGQ